MSLKYFPLFLLSFSLLGESNTQENEPRPLNNFLNVLNTIPTLSIEEKEEKVECVISSPFLKDPYVTTVPQIMVWNDENNKGELETKTAAQNGSTGIRLQGRTFQNLLQIAVILVLKGQTHTVQGIRLLPGKHQLFPKKMSSCLDLKQGTWTLTIPAQEKDPKLEQVTTIATTIKEDKKNREEVPTDEIESDKTMNN